MNTRIGKHKINPTLRDIHQAILSIYPTKITHAARKLGMTKPGLNILLVSAGTSWDEISQLDEKEAAAKFSSYNEPIVEIDSNLNNYTLHEIHLKIIGTKNLSEAASKFPSTGMILLRYLNEFGTSYDELKLLDEENAKYIFNNYDECISVEDSKQPKKKRKPNPIFQSYPRQTIAKFPDHIDLENLTLHTLHLAILATPSITRAAKLVKIDSRAFIRHLAKLGTNDEELKTLDEIAAKNKFKSYDEKIVDLDIALEIYTIRAIHPFIIKYSMSKAAAYLGVTSETLKRHLSKIGLSYDLLHNLSVTEAENKYKSNYDKAIRDWSKLSKTNSRSLTICNIHLVIQQSDNITDAASKIGIDYRVLKKYLIRFNTDYDTLKKMTVNDAKNYFDDKYGKTLREASNNTSIDPASIIVDHAHLTLHTFHLAILASKNIFGATKILKMSMETILRYLAKLGTSESELRELDEATAEHRFKHYHDKIASITVQLENFTLREIHETIIDAKSLSHAASYLGVTSDRLIRRLKMHNLSYDLLKKSDTNECCDLYGANYDSQLKNLPKSQKDSDHNTISSQPSYFAQYATLGLFSTQNTSIHATQTPSVSNGASVCELPHIKDEVGLEDLFYMEGEIDPWVLSYMEGEIDLWGLSDMESEINPWELFEIEDAPDPISQNIDENNGRLGGEENASEIECAHKMRMY